MLDTEDEGWTVHHDSRADAEQTANRYGFTRSGDKVFCKEDALDDAEPLPQEIPGQLVLPGVNP